MTEFQTGFAIGASVGACFVGVIFLVAGSLVGRSMRRREREDAWPYRSEGHLW